MAEPKERRRRRRSTPGLAVVWRFGPEDLLRIRFAFSPLYETMGAVRMLADPARRGAPASWLRAVEPRLAELGLEPLLALTSPNYSPDFLSPPPVEPAAEIAAELRRVRSAQVAQVRAELRTAQRVLGTKPPERTALLEAMLDDPRRARDELAALLERCWEVLVAPWWPRLRDALETDVAYQGRRLAEGGTAALFAGLHAEVRWRDGVLHVPATATGPVRSLDGQGLLLMPSVLSSDDGIGTQLDRPWQPTLTYPARATGRLWSPMAPDRSALVALIGRRRAALLTALGEPATTTGLARRCGVPLSSVSEHLAVLRAAALVSTRRTGRHLTHQRTPLGSELLGDEGGGAGDGGRPRRARGSGPGMAG